MLQELHVGALEGHLGEEKLLGKLKERFFWPGMQQDARDWCRTCEFCATRKTAPKKNCAPLQTIKAGFPMQIVAVDILGPLPKSVAGNSYVLVASDYFTKWMEAYAIPNQEAITVARKLTDEMFCRFSRQTSCIQIRESSLKQKFHKKSVGSSKSKRQEPLHITHSVMVG